MSLYMEPGLRAQMTPHFDRLGALAGNRLDELAQTADKHPPVLQPRDRFGRDEDWIDYHPSYREMEKIAFDEFGMHAMSHRAGVLGMSEPAHPLVKYAITYLFVQAEFGLMCPVSVSDTSNFMIKRYGSPALKKLLLDRLLSQDPATMLKGTQFMTEKAGGSDVGAIETEAERIGVGADGVERWSLHGQKWFCSHADADVAVLLARPRGGRAGHTGPRHVRPAAAARGRQPQPLPDRAAEGQARHALDGVGRDHPRRRDGLSGRRRRAGLQADDGAGQPVAAQPRRARRVDDAALPERGAGRRARPPRLRQGDRGVSAAAPPADEDHAADRAGAVDVRLLRRHDGPKADKGDKDAANLLRILTPVYKFRACRDNIPVASQALEVRGGIGYIEEWVTARLVRDAQIGTLWEGTSNINALDVVQRAVGKAGGHKTLTAALKAKYEPSGSLPGQYKGLLGSTLDRVERFAEAVAADPEAREARPPRRRRALSRHDGRADGVGRRDPRRTRRRCPPPAAVTPGDRAPPRPAGPAVAQRVSLGAGSDGPPARRRACAAGEGDGAAVL